MNVSAKIIKVGEFMSGLEKYEPKKSKTDSGLDENLAGLLCYLLGFITGVIFLLIEKDNRFVRFHALQSIFISIVIVVLNFALNLIPLLGLFLNFIIAIAAFILWIVLMMKAYQGQWFKLPIIGDVAEKQVK